jgi:hypothetical protein
MVITPTVPSASRSATSSSRNRNSGRKKSIVSHEIMQELNMDFLPGITWVVYNVKYTNLILITGEHDDARMIRLAAIARLTAYLAEEDFVDGDVDELEIDL